MVPRDGKQASGQLSFQARSTVDLDTPIDVPVSDLNTSGLYFRIALELPEGITEGEYEYELRSGDVILSTGLLYVGELPTERAQEYEKTVEYEQY